jgi:hypothetical protein
VPRGSLLQVAHEFGVVGDRKGRRVGIGIQRADLVGTGAEANGVLFTDDSGACIAWQAVEREG